MVNNIVIILICRLDLYNKHLLYGYEYKLDVIIEKFSDEKGNSVTGNKPLLLHIGKY